MSLTYPAPHGPHILCTVDTGKRKAGLAIWLVVGGEAVLLWAGLVRASTAHGRTRRGHGRAWKPAHMVGALILARASVLGRAHALKLPCVWVVERPRKYANKRRQHKDLDSLLAVIDALVEVGAGRVVRRYVHAWKGNVPKTVHHARALSALRSNEWPIAGGLLDPLQDTYQDDAADAIALGLFETGRVGRGGKRP